MQMIHVIVMGTETTKSIGFSKTKMRTKVDLVLNSHHKINKHNMCKQESNKILLQKQNNVMIRKHT
jgi:hypothetical protein